MSPAADELLAHLTFAPDDPRSVAGLLLRQLTAALDQQPGNVGLAREVRQVLGFLAGDTTATPGPGEVDVGRVQFLLDRLRAWGC